MRESELSRALAASVACCQPSAHWKNHLINQIVTEEKLKKRTKVSVGIVLAIVLVLLSMVALAVSILNRSYYEKVAKMDANGALDRWELRDKITFVSVMKENNFEIDQAEYEMMMDASLPDNQREAAADRIVNHTYGELIRAQLGYYITEEEDSLGLAPDPVIVFEERYLAEHPEGIETHEQVRDYTDALGYYLRDVYDPFYARYQAGQWPEPADSVIVDEAYAVRRLRDTMTEVMGWDPEAVESMIPVVEWDEAYHMWTVSGEVSAESMEKVTDPRKGLSPCLSGLGVEKTETGYRLTVLVDDLGNQSMETLDKGEFLQLRLAIPESDPAVVTIDSARAFALAEQAVQDQYHLSRDEIRKYFGSWTPVGLNAEHHLLYRVDFCDHYAIDRTRIYGAVVNLGAGTVESIFDYRYDEDPRWQVLAYAAEKEQTEGLFVSWLPESKQRLAVLIRDCQLLPDHPFWDLEAPSEADTTAFISEVFERSGFASTVSAASMASVLFGPEDGWSWDIRSRIGYLADIYHFRSKIILPDHAGASEITSDEAVQLIRVSVCRAWQMPDDALNNWASVAQLVQSDTALGSIVFYRVFLTRPDSELGRDTFGGKDNMNYRVSLEGIVLDSSVNPSWRSPDEDVHQYKEGEPNV